jgi:predicted nucleotidyltransferase
MGIEKLIDFLHNNNSVTALALGGSRARNTYTSSSDYDLFALIRDDNFCAFIKDIDEIFTNNSILLISTEWRYQEGWGYLHKGIDNNNIKYDISYLPESRISEMGIKSSNIIYFDKTGKYTDEVKNNNDDINLQFLYMQRNKTNNEDKFIINAESFLFAYKNEDYWSSIKYIERLRELLMLLIRTKQKKVSKNYFSPEKNFEKEIDHDLKVFYKIGTEADLKNTFNMLIISFCKLIDSSKLSLLAKIVKASGFELNEAIGVI